MTSCPCGSEKSYETCCEPVISGKAADTPEALMRSRYSAFVVGKLDHIEATNTPKAMDSFDRFEMEASLADTEWLGLTIIDAPAPDPSDSDAVVRLSFRYRYKGKDRSQTEIAHFVRSNGRWLYDDGELNPKSPPVRVTQIGRNDPCPCGSGKKYKKCCGA